MYELQMIMRKKRILKFGQINFMNNKGVTIVEVIVASALLILAAGGILALSLQNIKLSKASDYYYVAVNLAKNRIERIRKIRTEKGINYLIPDEEEEYKGVEEEDTIVNRDGVKDANGDFVRTTEIETILIGDGGKPELVKVTVKVNYKIMQILRPQPVELVTVVTEGEYLGS